MSKAKLIGSEKCLDPVYLLPPNHNGNGPEAILQLTFEHQVREVMTKLFAEIVDREQFKKITDAVLKHEWQPGSVIALSMRATVYKNSLRGITLEVDERLSNPVYPDMPIRSIARVDLLKGSEDE